MKRALPVSPSIALSCEPFMNQTIAFALTPSVVPSVGNDWPPTMFDEVPPLIGTVAMAPIAVLYEFAWFAAKYHRAPDAVMAANNAAIALIRRENRDRGKMRTAATSAAGAFEAAG